MTHVSKRLFVAALVLAVGCDDGGEFRDHRDDGGEAAEPPGTRPAAPAEDGEVAEEEGETQDPRCSLPRTWQIVDAPVFRQELRNEFGPGEHFQKFHVHQRLFPFEAVALLLELRSGRAPFEDGYKLGRFEYSAKDELDPGLFLWAGGDRFSVDGTPGNLAFRQVYEATSAVVTITRREVDDSEQGGVPVRIALEDITLEYKAEEEGYECETSVDRVEFGGFLIEVDDE